MKAKRCTFAILKILNFFVFSIFLVIKTLDPDRSSDKCGFNECGSETVYNFLVAPLSVQKAYPFTILSNREEKKTLEFSI
jgi:hypothetical protein